MDLGKTVYIKGRKAVLIAWAMRTNRMGKLSKYYLAEFEDGTKTLCVLR